MNDTRVACSVPCNLCGAIEAEVVSRRDRDGRPLQTVMCNDCGLVWTDPRPGEEEIRHFYADDYRTSYKGSAQPKLKHVLRETGRAIARYRRIEPLLFPGARVLDVGSGAGFFPHVVGSRGYEVVGIEPNRGYCEWGRETFSVDVRNGTIGDFEFSVEPFDLVTLNHVLEHLPDPASALSTLRQWLKPGGFLVVEVPNVESTFHAPQKRFHIGHLYNFSPMNLTRLASARGLVAKDLLLQPGTQHINIVFTPSEPETAVRNWRLPENAARVRKVLRSHTGLRHYGTPATHLRAVAKWAGYVREKILASGGLSPRELSDREIQRAFSIK